MDYMKIKTYLSESRSPLSSASES